MPQKPGSLLGTIKALSQLLSAVDLGRLILAYLATSLILHKMSHTLLWRFPVFQNHPLPSHLSLPVVKYHTLDLGDWLM